MITELDNEIRSNFTPEQLNLWDGHTVVERLIGELRDAELTNEQISAIRQQAPREFEIATRAADPFPRATSYVALKKWAEAHVLSPRTTRYYQIS